MINGSAGIGSSGIDHPFFLYQGRTGILTGNASSVRSEVLATSHGRGSKSKVLRRKHQQFHQHLRVQ